MNKYESFAARLSPRERADFLAAPEEVQVAIMAAFRRHSDRRGRGKCARPTGGRLTSRPVIGGERL